MPTANPAATIKLTRTPTPSALLLWAGNPVDLTLTFDPAATGNTFTGADSLRLEIHPDRLIDPARTPLALLEYADPTGTSKVCTFTAPQLNLVPEGVTERQLWLIIYATYPDSAGPQILQLLALTLRAHPAALLAGPPPDVPTSATALTKGQADLLYATRLDILEAGPSSAAQSRQHILEGAGPLEIIPVMRNFSNVGQEKLGLWYSTDDGRTFADLYPGDLFTAPPSSGGGVRDPSLLIRPEAWYLAYTSGSFGYSSSWGLAKSTNRGRTWTYIKNVEVADSVSAATSGTGAATWGPSWFVDPATGKTHIIISISTGGGNHVAYIQTATSAHLENWTDGDPISGDPLTSSVSHVYWDIRVTYAGGYYYLVTCYDAQSLRIYRAASVAGPYTLYKQPAPFTATGAAIEQCQLHYLGAGRWRLNYTKVADYELFIAESHDNLETWQTPVKVLDYDPSGPTPHQFSELVRIRSRISDPLPVNSTTAAAGTLTGNTLASNVTASSLQSLGTLTGTVPGTTTGTSAPLGVQIGTLAGTARVVWGTGSNNQTWAVDNAAGTLRWICQDSVKMSLTDAGVLSLNGTPLTLKNLLAALPTSSAGLATGDPWLDSGTLKVIS